MLKKIVIFLLTIILSLLLIFTSILNNTNILFDDLIAKTYTKEYFVDNIIDYSKKSIPEINDAAINKFKKNISKSNTVDDMYNKMLKTLTSDLLNNITTNVDITESVKSILNFYYNQNNIGYFEQQYVNDKILKINYNDVYIDLLSNIRGNQNIERVIKLYNFLTLSNIHIVMYVLISITIAIISLVSMSMKFLKPLYIALYINSICCLVVIPFFIEEVLPGILSKIFHLNIVLATSSLTKTGIKSLLIAFLFTLIYIIFKKVNIEKN